MWVAHNTARSATGMFKPLFTGPLLLVLLAIQVTLFGNPSNARAGSAAAGPQTSVQNTKLAARMALPIRFQNWETIQINAIMTKLAKDDNFAAARAALDTLCDQAISRSPQSQPRIIRRAYFARELVTQLATVENRKMRQHLLAYLRKHHVLAQTLVFLVEMQQPQWPLIYAMLDHLHQALGKKAARYPNLTAAICSVLYKPFTAQLNENPAHSPDPVKLWKFYVANQNAMFFGIKRMPAELLIYVVDGTTSIRDHRWALAKYHGNPDPGQLFFTIKYDYGFLHGHALRIDTAGFTLPNILAYGGVCVDQAYFSTEVAKDIGVPSALDEAMGNDAGHAWAGFLQARGRQGWWNFLSGRYQEYRGIQGHVTNPQTRREEPDTFISLSSQLIHTTAHDRWNAAALTDAAERLAEIALLHKQLSPNPLPKNVRDIRQAPRMATISETQVLLRHAIKSCDGYAPAWFMVSSLAQKGKLRYREKKEWARSVMRLCGRRYPDFAMAVLTPMILTVKDASEQNALWNQMFDIFAQTRFDLAGEVRMYQAAMWEKAGKPQRAGQCYMNIINRFASDGPFIMGAIRGAQKVLESQGRKPQVLQLWEIAWQNIKPPGGDLGNFVKESVWYQVGVILKRKLIAAGQTNKAKLVDNKLHQLLASAGVRN